MFAVLRLFNYLYCMKRAFFTLIFIISLIPSIVEGQIITTVAGNGTYVWAGDTGQATAAPVAGPFGVAFDISANMYIADFGFARVHKVNTSGIISQFAGNGSGSYCGDGGPAIAACIPKPFDVATDAAGNVYIADYYNNAIRKVNTAGIITTVAGNGTHGYTGDGGPATAAQLEYPNGVTCDAAGNIYITSSHSVRKVNTAGIITTIAGDSIAGYSGDGGPATAAKLFQPWGVTVDAVGNVYITDNNNNVIRKVNTAGIITTIAGNGLGAGTGTGGFSGDGGLATAAELYTPIGGVALDGAGNMYISDFKNNRIRMVNAAGIISTIAGTGFGAPTSGAFSGDGGLATAAELYYPMGVDFDAAGNLYISDEGNYRVRMISNVDVSVNATERVNESISIYPNPFNESIALESEAEFSLVQIHNSLGELVYENKKIFRNQQIDVRKLTSGIYFCKVRTVSGEKTFKLIKTD